MLKLFNIFKKREKRIYREPYEPLFEEINKYNLNTWIKNITPISMEKQYIKNIKNFLSDVGLSDRFIISREKFLSKEESCIRVSSKAGSADEEYLVRKFSDNYYLVTKYQGDKFYVCDGIQGVKQILYQVKKDINTRKKLQKILDELAEEWNLKRQKEVIELISLVSNRLNTYPLNSFHLFELT